MKIIDKFLNFLKTDRNTFATYILTLITVYLAVDRVVEMLLNFNYIVIKKGIGMQEEYVRETRLIKKTEIEKEIELIRTIIKTREELKSNNMNFEYAKDDLVDYYTYQIKANQAKLDYLIKLAKARGIKVDMINDKKYSFLDNEEAG